MMRIGLLPINLFGCGYYRLLIPMRKMEEKFNGYKNSALFTKHLNLTEQEEDLKLYEVLKDETLDRIIRSIT